MKTITPYPPRDPAHKIIDRTMIALAPIVPILFLVAYFGGR
jgi:hypothetical protein